MDKKMLKTIITDIVSSAGDLGKNTGTLIAMVDITLTEYTVPLEGTFRHAEVKKAISNMMANVLDTLDEDIFDYSKLVLDAKVDYLGYVPNLYEENLIHYQDPDKRKACLADVEWEIYYILENTIEIRNVIINSHIDRIVDTVYDEMVEFEANPEDIFITVHQWERGDIYNRRSHAVNLHEYIVSAMTERG